MKYYIDYQYLPKGKSRPIDDGQWVNISSDNENIKDFIPNVGDFVSIDGSFKDRNAFHGKVKSRLFRYILHEDNNLSACMINIVVEETNDDWGLLVKE